jgi:hypothetical protein
MALRDAQLGSRVTKAMALRLERGGARAELIIIMREPALREVLVATLRSMHRVLHWAQPSARGTGDELHHSGSARRLIA